MLTKNYSSSLINFWLTICYFQHFVIKHYSLTLLDQLASNHNVVTSINGNFRNEYSETYGMNQRKVNCSSNHLEIRDLNQKKEDAITLPGFSEVIDSITVEPE